jgi:GxxExxY protein
VKDLGGGATEGLTRITRMNANVPNKPAHPSPAVIVEKELSHTIVSCFFEVYNELGYGFLESIYARALEIAMQARGLRVDREYPVIVTFRGQQIGFHRIDMVVERRVVVELKATERLAESARRQIRSCVTALGFDLGILLHFGPMPRFQRELGGRRVIHGCNSGDSS